MSRKKKNQQGKQSDLAIAKLALLAGALEVAGAIINLLATIIDKMTQYAPDGGREAEASRPSSLLYQARR